MPLHLRLHMQMQLGDSAIGAGLYGETPGSYLVYRPKLLAYAA